MALRLDDLALLDLAVAPRLAHPSRALRLLERAGVADAAALPLGARDAALVALRVATFGPEIACVDACPACGAELELVVPAAALLGAVGGEAGPLAVGDGRRPARPLTTADLLAVRGLPRAEARARLAAAAAGSDTALTEAEIAAVERWLEAADPLAHVELRLECAACGAGWARPFDPAGLLWAECAAAGRRVMREVAALAMAFGWDEAAILAVPPARRRAYLELAAP